MAQRHEIPTHLNVEDKAFYGLSARQVMYLTVGFSGSYALWTAYPALPVGVRLALILVCVLAALTLALLRPHGRGLEDWLFIGLRYLVLPRVCHWQPRADDGRQANGDTERWADLTPTVAWREEAS